MTTRVSVDASATPREVHLRTAVWLRDLLNVHGIDYFAFHRDLDHLDLGIAALDAEKVRALIAGEWETRPFAYGFYAEGSFVVDAHRGGPPPGSFNGARAVRLVLAVGPAGVDWAWPIDVGVSLHMWKPLSQGVLGAPIANRHAPYLLQSTQDDVTQLEFRGEAFRTFGPLAHNHVEDVAFPVDLVYTWVNGDDPLWRKRMLQRKAEVLGQVTENAVADARFHDLEELRYSLRSVHAFAPWINRIWIVTDGQVPSWLRSDDGKVTVVDHREIWDDPDGLPVFNSHAIEARIHHIDGLSEHYIYFNDDMMFGNEVDASQFFTPGGLMHIFESPNQIGLGSRTLQEGAAQTAAKNDREIMLEATGSIQTHRLKHAGYPQLRSVALELESRFPDQYRATAQSPFRSPTDLSCISLQSWFAYRTGRAAKRGVEFEYIDLMTEGDLRAMRSLGKRRDIAIMCLNQSENSQVPVDVVESQLHDFLSDYFPVPSPWETTP